MGLKADGTVVIWGNQNYYKWTNLLAPDGLSNIVAVAAGAYESAALTGDGTVIQWGAGFQPTSREPITNAVELAGNWNHFMALRRDETVVSWGSFQSVIPPDDLTNAVAIAAGNFHSIAVRDDGTVETWGMSREPLTVPPGLSNVVKVAGGD